MTERSLIARPIPSRKPCLTAVLRMAGLRPTRQRVALAELLFAGPHRHVSAEQLHAEARRDGAKVSLATVYNTLNQFTAAGLLREVSAGPGRIYFDTNVSAHHHFLIEDESVLVDIPAEQVVLAKLPAAPDGLHIERVDVVVRVRK